MTIQNLELGNSDFQKLNNFEINECIIHNRKLLKMFESYFEIVFALFKKTYFLLRCIKSIYLDVLFKVRC